MKARVINPNQVVFDGEVEHIIAPGTKGDLGILQGHTPFFAELVAGTVVLTLPGGKDQQFQIEAGFIKVRADEATILIGL